MVRINIVKQVYIKRYRIFLGGIVIRWNQPSVMKYLFIENYISLQFPQFVNEGNRLKEIAYVRDHPGVIL